MQKREDMWGFPNHIGLCGTYIAKSLFEVFKARGDM